MATVDGLYMTASLPDHLDEPALLAAAARGGVGVEGLSLHSYTGDCPPGVVLGHAYMAEPAIERGIELLAAAAARI
jgi:GntR family transcriptional regulator/MocR family aminotransferase